MVNTHGAVTVHSAGTVHGAVEVWPLVAAAVVGVLGVAAAAVVVIVVVGRRRHRRACRGACWVTVLPAPAVDPHGAVQFWRSALGLLLPDRWTARLTGVPHLVFEYRFRPAGIEIGIWVPGTVAAELVASAVRAAWPGTRTTITPADPDPDLGHLTTTADPTAGTGRELVVQGGVLRLARPHGLPIQDTHAEDPARGVLAAPGLLGPGQWARIQILARPITGARLARLARTHASGRRRSGVMAGAAVGLATGVVSAAASVVADVMRDLVNVASAGSSSGSRPRHSAAAPAAGSRGRVGPGPQRVMDSAADRAVAGKLGGAGGGFVTAVRYVAATSTRPAPQFGVGADSEAWDRARARSRGIAHGLASGFAVFSGHNHFRRRPLRRPVRTLVERRLRRGDVLSVPELAAMAHLPTSEHVPGLRRAGAAAVAPPPQVPAAGPGIKPLGVSDAVTGRPIGVSVPDARHHLWVVGATGAGKSTLLVHGVLADAQAGRSAVVLDPKGDLIGDILTRLPDRARARTVVIDPATPQRRRDGSLAWPVLNPLSPHPGRPNANAPGAGRVGAASAVGDPAMENVVTIFSRVFAAAWGFRSDDLLRVACLTARAGRATPTLAALPALLSDPDTRARAVALLPRSSRLREFWSWFERLSEPARAQISAPLLNKLRAVLLRPFAEQVLCAGPSTVDLAGLLDGGGLLLVRLPKGVLGEETTRLLGSLIVAQVWQAAIARAAIPEQARRDASLVLDECQNFLHLPYRIEDMLAEARGFRLSLTLAHQHLAQLTPELRDGIATNARNKIAFLSSPEDAARLAKHTLPELGAHDLAHLDAFHAAARLMCQGSESRAFTLTTRPLPDPTPRQRPERPIPPPPQLTAPPPARSAAHRARPRPTGPRTPRPTTPPTTPRGRTST